MMIRRRTVFLILITSVLFSVFPITPIGAVWLPTHQITRDVQVNEIHPSVAVNPVDRSVGLVFTYEAIGLGTKDVYFTDNLELIYDAPYGYDTYGIPDWFADEKVCISDYYTYNTTDNDYPDVAYTDTGNVFVVYQARINISTPEPDHEIIYAFLSNRTVKTSGVLVPSTSSDTADDTKPKVVAFDNQSAVIAWLRGGSAAYSVLTDPTSYTALRTIGSSVTEFDLAVSRANSTAHYIHLAYTQGTNITYARKTGDAGTDFTVVTTLIPASGCYNISIAAAGTYIAIVYQSSSGDIKYFISSDNGNTWSAEKTALVVGASVVGHPSFYITDFGRMEIFFEKNADPWDIYVIDNFNADADTWSTPRLLIGGQTLVKNMEPTVAYMNDTVFGVYTKSVNPGSGWEDFNLFAWGYHLFYNNTSANNYDVFNLNNEDPLGVYLIEGLEITYGELDAPLALNITMVDTVTGVGYSNITVLDTEGGTLKKYLFFDPGKYVITNNTYNLTIYFVNNTDDVLRVSINPWEIWADVNGTDVTPRSEYDIAIDNSSGLFSIYDIQMKLLLEYGATGRFVIEEGQSWANTFNDENFADFGLITMEKNERYNFTFYTYANYSVRAMIFRSDVQELKPSNALFIWQNDKAGLNYSDWLCNETGTYFVLVENLDYNTTVNYYFEYDMCPANITLLSPNNNEYFRWNETDIWANNVKLKWIPRLSDKDIDYYVVQVSNTSDFSAYVNETIVKAPTTEFTFYAQPEQWYYWRVKAVDDKGNEGYFHYIRRFCFDSVTPDAPVINEPPPLFTGMEITFNWSIPSDGAFSVDYYIIYRSTDPNFVPGPEYAIVKNGTIKYPSFSEYVERNDRYYYYVTAVDHVGHESPPSNMITVTVSYGGTVDASHQQFEVRIGDIIEYEVTWVKSSKKDPYQNDLMTFRGRDFEVGSRFHFWIKSIDRKDVLPIRGDFYARYGNISARPEYFLIEKDVMLVPFVTDANETYQQACFDLYVKNLLPDYEIGSTLERIKYYSTWSDGAIVRDVVCYTYYSPVVDNKQTSATFIVDRLSGVMLEMTVYNRDTDYGYSLRLVDTTVQLSQSAYTYSPLIIPAILLTVAGVIYAVMKKLEL